MIQHIQTFRDKLAAGQLCLGAGITFNDPAVVESLAALVDFLWIDLEHSPVGFESLLAHLIAARAGGAPALVRVPGSEVPFIKRVLDAGAEGIIVPQVRSAREVEQVVAACRYPPLGRRGWGPRRPADYGRRPQAQVVDEANQRLFVVAQIETVEAVDEIEAIVALEGLDSVVVGPYDLSASLGVLGQLEHPQVVQAIEQIVAVAHRAGRWVGFGDEAAAQSCARWARMGADWIQCGGDYAYMNLHARQLLDEVRGAVGTRLESP